MPLWRRRHHRLHPRRCARRCALLRPVVFVGLRSALLVRLAEQTPCRFTSTTATRRHLGTAPILRRAFVTEMRRTAHQFVAWRVHASVAGVTLRKRQSLSVQWFDRLLKLVCCWGWDTSTIDPLAFPQRLPFADSRFADDRNTCPSTPIAPVIIREPVHTWECRD